MIDEVLAFHRALPGYAPTPLRELPQIAAELGLERVALKDESDRLGLPAFKILGASWAVERALREAPGTHTLVAASAGNHGRAVARVARMRGLRCRIYLPARSAAVRREAIAGEGAELHVVDGTYEAAVARAREAGREPGRLEVADVGASAPAHWVIEGYGTLFAELPTDFDVVYVPVGVGSLGAAAARWATAHNIRAVAVEPETAACLTASLAAGEPTAVPTPGTTMAGLDCAEVSEAAWPILETGIHATVTVTDAQARAAMDELSALGLWIGECGAAPLAALRARPDGPRALLIATEGQTAAG